MCTVRYVRGRAAEWHRVTKNHATSPRGPTPNSTSLWSPTGDLYTKSGKRGARGGGEFTMGFTVYHLTPGRSRVVSNSGRFIRVRLCGKTNYRRVFCNTLIASRFQTGAFPHKGVFTQERSVKKNITFSTGRNPEHQIEMSQDDNVYNVFQG